MHLRNIVESLKRFQIHVNGSDIVQINGSDIVQSKTLQSHDIEISHLIFIYIYLFHMMHEVSRKCMCMVILA